MAKSGHAPLLGSAARFVPAPPLIQSSGATASDDWCRPNAATRVPATWLDQVHPGSLDRAAAVSETVDANRSGTAADDQLGSVDRAEQDCSPLVAGRYRTGQATEAPRYPCRAVALGFGTERCAQPLPRSYFSYFVGASARPPLLTAL